MSLITDVKNTCLMALTLRPSRNMSLRCLRSFFCSFFSSRPSFAFHRPWYNGWHQSFMRAFSSHLSPFFTQSKCNRVNAIYSPHSDRCFVYPPNDDRGSLPHPAHHGRHSRLLGDLGHSSPRSKQLCSCVCVGAAGLELRESLSRVLCGTYTYVVGGMCFRVCFRSIYLKNVCWAK